MDVTDIASEREDFDRELALRHQLQRAGMDGKRLADSAQECADCGEPIPEARRAAVPGVTRCIECQARAEARRKQRKTF